jgi:hypothetical protein
VSRQFYVLEADYLVSLVVLDLFFCPIGPLVNRDSVDITVHSIETHSDSLGDVHEVIGGLSVSVEQAVTVAEYGCFTA